MVVFISLQPADGSYTGHLVIGYHHDIYRILKRTNYARIVAIPE